MKPVIEDLFKLSVNQLSPHLRKGGGVIEGKASGFPFRLDHPEPGEGGHVLEIRRGTLKVLGKEHLFQLSCQIRNHGRGVFAHRWWAICPGCKRRCADLYWTIESLLGCRVCLRLAYRMQNLSHRQWKNFRTPFWRNFKEEKTLILAEECRERAAKAMRASRHRKPMRERSCKNSFGR